MLISTYPVNLEDKGIPVSDAASEVVAIGSTVSRIGVGDRVCPIFTLEEAPGFDAANGQGTGVGSGTPGLLRECAVINEHHLVNIPEHISYKEVRAIRALKIGFGLTLV